MQPRKHQVDANDCRKLIDKGLRQNEQSHTLAVDTNTRVQEVTDIVTQNFDRVEKLLMLVCSPLGESQQPRTQKGGCDFIDTWLDTISTTGEADERELDAKLQITTWDDRREANERVLAASNNEVDIYAVATRSGKEFQKQNFTFGVFKKNFVVNIAIPKAVWSAEGYKEEPYEKTEHTLRRYMAVTTEPGNFAGAGFRLRQQIYGRETERLIAVPISHDLESDNVVERVSNVVDSVRALISNCGVEDSWMQIVVGFFCDMDASTETIALPQILQTNVLTRMGLIAQWPVKVEMEKDINSFVCGIRYPTYMSLTSDIGTKSLKKIQAHVHEVGFAAKYVTIASQKLTNTVHYLIGPNDLRWAAQWSYE
jgi:hypothetical protein